MTRSEPGPTVKVEPSTRRTCTRPLVVVLMRSLKKIDLPILSWVCGDPERLEKASGLTAAATPTFSASAGPVNAARPSDRHSSAVALTPHSRPLGLGDNAPMVIPQNLFCTPRRVVKSSYFLIS